MATARTALITGATEGIGKATALALGEAGWQVGVCARTATRVDATLNQLRAAGIRASGKAADVSDPAQVGVLVAQIEKELGPIDALVNNAGILVGKHFLELSLEEWDRTMATNVRSLFVVTRAVLPGMLERQRGTVVNVASLAGRNGFVGGTAYAASKHAVLGFSRSLMLETRKQGIRVIAICPGSVATGMLENQPLLRADADKILMPEDVARMIVTSLELPLRALVSELDVRPTNP